LNKRQIDLILGLDIFPGDRQNPTYAAVILNKAGLRIFENKIKRTELISLINKYRIKTVAIDNIFELFPTTREIMDFIRKTRVRLIQVTGPLGKETKLTHLARIHGLSYQSKLSPSKAAEICARLALMGIGSEIKIFEDITEITVTRSRSLGEGGQHQSKYARVIASVIQSATREISDILNENGLKYDLYYREGDFGLKSAKFIVYAPYETVKKVVTKYHGDLFRIDLKPLETKRIMSLPTDRTIFPKKLLICGIDPGETTGLAVLDLTGKVIFVGSRKNFGLTSIVEKIYEFGKPVIIATDVPKMPQFVERLCSKTGAICYNPRHPISIAEKNEMIRQLNLEISNSHERDALIAALMAYKKYKNLFQKIDSVLSYIPIKINGDEIKKEVIQGKSIRDAIRRYLERGLSHLLQSQLENLGTETNKQITIQQKLIQERERLRQKLSNAISKIKQLEEKISELEKELKEKNIEIEKLKDLIIKKEKIWQRKINEKIEELKDDYIKEIEQKLSEYQGIISAQRNRIARMERYIVNLKSLLYRDKDKIPIKRLIKFTREEIEKLNDMYGILPGDIIYVEDPSGGGKKTAQLLINKGIRAIIVRENKFSNESLEAFELSNIPILLREDFEAKIDLESDIEFVTLGQFNIALKNMKLRTLPEDEAISFEIEAILDEWRKKRLEDVIEDE